jgi:hypothetical protein
MRDLGGRSGVVVIRIYDSDHDRAMEAHTIVRGGPAPAA